MLQHTVTPNSHKPTHKTGCAQTSDVKGDKTLGPLWAQYREALFLQIKVERPELIVKRPLLFTRVNQ